MCVIKHLEQTDRSSIKACDMHISDTRKDTEGRDCMYVYIHTH